jgi:UDP-N-acetylglucosamine--N-acetylmuramyl-(pentapeptide) pyrophosphoryl-undecaprenol N-acetylglucosamine transferase
MPKTKTIIVTAAGTGGHVFPGLAVAQYLKKQNCNMHWIGSNGMEAGIIPKHDISFHKIDFSGIRGKGIVKLIMAPFLLINAILQAKKILKQLNADLVLAMGGYISVPVGIAAKILGIPLVIHEQNAVPGMSNKILSKFANKTLLGFDKSISGGHYTGNPVRENFISNNSLDADSNDYSYSNHGSSEGNISNTLKILVLGGSLGAKVLNDIVPQAIKLIGNTKSLQIVHQSGKKHIDELISNYSKYSVKGHTVDFIEDMKSAYEWADLVICRSGAMTIAELCTIGVPAILIPFPHAVDDHQTKNAQLMSAAKAAWLIPQSQLTAQKLADIIKNVSHEKLRQMSLKAKLHSHQTATQRVASICLNHL